jgi:hypothetical protein
MGAIGAMGDIFSTFGIGGHPIVDDPRRITGGNSLTWCFRLPSWIEESFNFSVVFFRLPQTRQIKI